MIGKGGGKPKAKVASMGRQRGSGAGSRALPPTMKQRPQQQGSFSRTNQNGNPADREKPNRRQKKNNPCFITEACTAAYGNPGDCYELSVLRMYRKEYVAALPDGAQVLEEYRRKAPPIVAAIDALGATGSREVWREIYHRGIQPAVRLITNGHWDEAYRHYRAMCRELEERFLSIEGSAVAQRAPNAACEYTPRTTAGERT